MKQKKLLVIDGQGGRMGAALVSQCKAAGLSAEIIAVGANSAATAAMLKAGADAAATGENPVVVNARDADVICGPMASSPPTPCGGGSPRPWRRRSAKARAQKVLIPVNRCSVTVVGVAELPLGDYVKLAVEAAKEQLEEK